MNGCSLFSGAGIAETFLEDVGISMAAANELIERRADLYSSLYENTDMVKGNILDSKVFSRILEASGKVDFLLASPPCQGMSIAGKNRTAADMAGDERNFLIQRAVQFIEIKKPDYILIENVPSLFKMPLLLKGKTCGVMELLSSHFSPEYTVEGKVVDASTLGVPQRRKRAVIKIYRSDLKWKWPSNRQGKTVKESIGHLPSLESGEKSDILWHFARKHQESHVLWMRHTPTGKSAFENKKFFPQKKDGSRIKGYMSCYRRISWDEPSPTITIRNDAISSQRNVHPGRRLSDGIYSDARVLTPLELMLLSSLPQNWRIPEDTPEILVRQCIGECIPPLMVKNLLRGIGSG